MMFYTTVAGWMLHYFYMTAAGKLSGLSADTVAEQFTRMLADPGVMMFWMVLVVVIGVVICAGGLQNGLERVTKYDDRTACHHGSTCHQQLLHGGSKGRSEVLSGT